MSIKFNVADIEVTVSDPIEAAALLRALKNQDEAASQPQAQSAQSQANGHQLELEKPESPPLVEVDPDLGRITLSVLRAIQAEPRGVKADTLMAIMGVSSPKAIGSRSAGMNKLIKDLGFNQFAVYKNPRKPGEGRTWYPGRKIGQAINAIEAALGR